MKAKKWGRIINITSEVFQRAVAPFSAYVAAKGGQIGWSRSMSRELAPFGITVNMVAPGWIPVERHENDPQEAKDEYLGADSGRPLGHAAGRGQRGPVLRQRRGVVRDRTDAVCQRRHDAVVGPAGLPHTR